MPTSNSQQYLMEIVQDEVRAAVDKLVRTKGRHCVPSFYAVTGSHIYGFPSEEGGDIDVRGFHLAEGERYALLDTPREQFIANQEDTTEGFERYEDIDIVSYELRKFTRLVFKSNFNILEVLFSPLPVVNGVPLEIERLKGLITEHLPLDVPRTYLGMARNNYRKFLDENRENYRPEAKKYLYVLRGLMAARYVEEEHDIEPDITVLASALGENEELVDQLIALKRENESREVPRDLAAEANEEIRSLFNSTPAPGDVDKSEFRRELDDWMLKVRG